MTLVTGLPLSDTDLQQLAKRLKAACGVGGTLKDGVIDQRDKVKNLLEADGHTVKRSGG